MKRLELIKNILKALGLSDTTERYVARLETEGTEKLQETLNHLQSSDRVFVESLKASIKKWLDSGPKVAATHSQFPPGHFLRRETLTLRPRLPGRRY